MDAPVLVILVLNVALALGCGIPLTRLSCRAGWMGNENRKVLGVLLLVYFIEGLAFMVSMGTSVLNVALAILWGVLLGLRLRERGYDRAVVLRLVGAFALYTSLPAVSFIFVPVLCAFSGWSVASAEAGHDFGLPGFVAWPMNTIVGYFTAVAVGTLILKTGITIGVVRGLAVRRRGRLATSA